MANLRQQAINTIHHRPTLTPSTEAVKVSDFFGINVFGRRAMQDFLPGPVFKQLMRSIELGERLDLTIADSVASGMRNWAMSRGATHYTHWFQPLTGQTAEKHDAFFDVDGDQAIEGFKGSSLVQQEPDASSFPSGGIRNTFEARGYTAWDPSSPAFIMDTGPTKTLCIPTIFVSYTGEALDNKTPLLKSLTAIDKAATAVCEYFGGDVVRVQATLGAEQEYFVVDEAFYDARPDLIQCGRTLIGALPAKGQQLEDHYFGSIPSRVSAFIFDFETECWKLGIPIRTRHNEVAPCQFECAPTFTEVNKAIDHNQLLMDVMQKVAERHRLRVLLHEKPFAGINGSGKHNNWSLATNTGKNLLSPGKRPKENLQFLTFFINTIKAVHDHADLLRASIASASNDYRLGANEAPPAIISIFIGSQLTSLLDAIERRDEAVEKGENLYLKLGLNKIPAILLDNTDRNRTSPFAFTGNKFELRAVGSSANAAGPMTILNGIVAHQLTAFKKEVDQGIKAGGKKETVIISILRRYISESRRILFEGNGYSEEWVEEAARRGLSNNKTTPKALEAYLVPKSVEMFESLKLLSHRELEARHEIYCDEYAKKIQIESLVLEELALTQIVPAASRHLGNLLQTLTLRRDAGLKQGSRLQETANHIDGHIEAIMSLCQDMADARQRIQAVESSNERAHQYCDEVKPFFDQIRQHCDALEVMVEDSIWPVIKYREIFFLG